MTQAAAKTASGPMTMVAIEQHFPKERRIADDALAYRMLPLNKRAYAWLMRHVRGRGLAARWTTSVRPPREERAGQGPARPLFPRS